MEITDNTINRNIMNILENLSKKAISKLKDKLSSNNRKDLEKFNMKGTLTYDEFIEKIKQQNNKCYICLQEFRYDGDKFCDFFPSPDRIYNFDIHKDTNIAASCTYCNLRMTKQKILGREVYKSCGFCPDLNHTYEGHIPTKSEVFRSLGNSNHRIYEYAKDTSRYQ
jgi:hypothetical protein